MKSNITKMHGQQHIKNLPFLFSYCYLPGTIGAEGRSGVFLWNIAHIKVYTTS